MPDKGKLSASVTSGSPIDQGPHHYRSTAEKIGTRVWGSSQERRATSFDLRPITKDDTVKGPGFSTYIVRGPLLLASGFRVVKRKFMLTLVPSVYQTLIDQADERGISIQELLRAVIVPHWLVVPPLPARSPTPTPSLVVAGPRPGQVGNRWPRD